MANKIILKRKTARKVNTVFVRLGIEIYKYEKLINNATEHIIHSNVSYKPGGKKWTCIFHRKNFLFLESIVIMWECGEMNMTDYSCCSWFHLFQAVDWWSVGVITYQLLTGEVFFEAMDGRKMKMLYKWVLSVWKDKQYTCSLWTPCSYKQLSTQINLWWTHDCQFRCQ